jgi:dCMP deaminase
MKIFKAEVFQLNDNKESNGRRDKINYYLDIAETVLERGTCLRRNYGAIIVKNDQIISTGYSGAPRGRKNCCDIGYCMREKLNIPRGERYELCRSVHAEMNAIIAAARNDMIGATLYLVGKDMKSGSLVQNASSCSMCKRLIINAGISTVVVRNTSESFTVIDVNREWVDNDESLSGVMGY